LREPQVRSVNVGNPAKPTRVLFEVTQIGSTEDGARDAEVSRNDFQLDDICETIRHVADAVWRGLSDLRAKRTVVEFGVEIAVESGNLTALIVKGSGKANLKITAEW